MSSAFAVHCRTDCTHGSSISPNSLWRSLTNLPAQCNTCGDGGENWVCLTCAGSYCSRYVNGDAAAHSASANHPIALSLSDLSVWCYECNDYIKIPEQADATTALYRLKFHEDPPIITQNQLASLSESLHDSLPSFTNEADQSLVSNHVSSDIYHEDVSLHNMPSQQHKNVIIESDNKSIEQHDIIQEKSSTKQHDIHQHISALGSHEKASPTKDKKQTAHSIESHIAKSPYSYIAPLFIYYNEDCIKHCIKHHPERPERVVGILSRLHQEWPEKSFKRASRISDENILRFHSKEHLQSFYECCEKAEKTGVPQYIDGDTAVMRDTRIAALSAAGSVINAVDDIFGRAGRKMKSAFCCVRPPGHHAEPNRSMGFCFFNNAGIGAKYAQEVYGISRVAVLDFDVHHGNGTEDGFEGFDNLFYGSTHEKDNYPGTGMEPRMKGELAQEIDRRIVNRYLIAGEQSKKDFHTKWAEIIDEMIRFKPLLVIISAGFDAHSDDPLGNCHLDDIDFAWGTQIVVEGCYAINPEAPPPILSVLEGGYDINAIADSASAHCKVLGSVIGQDIGNDRLVEGMKALSMEDRESCKSS